MSRDQQVVEKEGVLRIELDAEAREIHATALRSLAASESTKYPRDFSSERLEKIKVLAAQVAN